MLVLPGTPSELAGCFSASVRRLLEGLGGGASAQRTLRAVELGFDRAWSYSSGEYEGLILRNGNQVLRIEGNQIDLTGTKTLADIRTWLAEGA